MALSEKSRSTLFRWMVDEIGEEATSEMLSCLPASEKDEPATKADLELTTARLDLRIAELETKIERQVNRLLTWFITTLLALAALTATVAGLAITVAAKLHG